MPFASGKRSETMETIWRRIDAWLARKAPELLAELQSGASEQEIQEAEKSLGIEFPADFRASLKIHNGLRHPYGAHKKDYGLLDGWTLFSLEAIVESWQTMEELRKGGDFEGQEGEARGPV